MIMFLIGFMGSGKSTMGRAMASRLGMRFVDMDTEIEREQGQTISEIFGSVGDAGFRQMEHQWLQGLENEDNLMVATGGGVPCFGDNMETMNRLGLTIYLKMRPEKLVARLKLGREKRPLIRDLDDEQLLSFVTTNLAQREPFYSQSKLTVDCEGVADHYICDHIERFVEQYNY